MTTLLKAAEAQNNLESKIVEFRNSIHPIKEASESKHQSEYHSPKIERKTNTQKNLSTHKAALFSRNVLQSEDLSKNRKIKKLKRTREESLESIPEHKEQEDAFLEVKKLSETTLKIHNEYLLTTMVEANRRALENAARLKADQSNELTNQSKHLILNQALMNHPQKVDQVTQDPKLKLPDNLSKNIAKVLG